MSYWANNQIYIDREVLRKSKLNYDLVEATIESYLNALSEVLVAFSVHKPFKPMVASEIVKRMQQSVYNKNSGDIQIIFQPFYFPGFWERGRAYGTNHGAWNSYDAHIPLIFYGSDIPQGRSYENII